MKKTVAIMLALALMLGLAACGSSGGDGTTASVTKKTVIEAGLPKTSAPLETWKKVSGSFTRQESNQYNNATLQMKYLGNSSAMFEFKLMEGSESGDWAKDIVLPFVLSIDEGGYGRYESDPKAKEPLKITLALSEDGKTVTAKHTGEMPISCDGVYEFIDNGLEVSEYSAAAILDFLPTAATSLNSNLGKYKMTYSQEVVADWFYSVDANFVDTGKALAKFIIAKDLSAVYRVDDDITPKLIFGTAQPMLDYEHYEYTEGEDDAELESTQAVLPLAWVESEAGVTLAPGVKTKLVASLPWALEHTIEAKSSKPAVVTVDKAGGIEAVAEGTSVVSGTLLVDGAKKAFSIEFTVAAASEVSEQ